MSATRVPVAETDTPPPKAFRGRSAAEHASLAAALLPAAELELFKKQIGGYAAAMRERMLAAAEFAAVSHKGQIRADGSPYISHPLAVAGIVANWHLDENAITAALLHDLLEDTKVNYQDLQERFGLQIAALVDGATKIEKIENVATWQIRQAASLRKMLLAVTQDWRVILIKLADRLHNMRTLVNLCFRKRKRIAGETLEIYAPIAERLGFLSVRDQLQTLSFQHLYPLRYAVLARTLEKSANERRKALPRIRKEIETVLKRNKIKARLEGRAKNIYSVYLKMRNKHLPFREVDDIIGFRLIVQSRAACYCVLGALHEKFRPVPFKIKDYIGLPKPNGYRSLHTTVIDRLGLVVELQIRTTHMHEFAEHGLASHWLYKNEKDGKGTATQYRTNLMLGSLNTMRERGGEPAEFLRNLRVDLFPDSVYALTPKGKILQLPRGATALDFAYAIHTDLGDSAVAAIIDGRSLPVSSKIKSGDMIFIQRTQAKQALQPQRLNFVVSGKARSHIRSVLRSKWSTDIVDLGRSLLDQALARNALSFAKLGEQSWLNLRKKHPSLKNKEDLFSKIALGKIAPEIIAIEMISGPNPQDAGKCEAIAIAGNNRAGINLASCCQPLPPEAIFGIMHKGLGMEVHRLACATGLASVPPKRRIALAWNPDSRDDLFTIRLRLECANRRGLFSSIIAALRTDRINVANINLTGGEKGNPVTIVDLTVEVANVRQFELLMRQLRAVPGVATVHRAGTLGVGSSRPLSTTMP